jgi:hypothetical protein
MTISKDQSTHGEYLILQYCFYWNICLMDYSSCHNVDKNGDHNIDSPCDQLNYNVVTYHYDAQLEHIKSNILEGIQKFGIRLV